MDDFRVHALRRTARHLLEIPPLAFGVGQCKMVHEADGGTNRALDRMPFLWYLK